MVRVLSMLIPLSPWHLDAAVCQTHILETIINHHRILLHILNSEVSAESRKFASRLQWVNAYFGCLMMTNSVDLHYCSPLSLCILFE